jgi:cytochrome c556
VGQIRRSAAMILRLAPDLVTWFPDGTGPGTGKTHAKAEIWQTPDDFATRANEFVRAAENFDSAAKSGDLGQIEASFGALGKSCKACHDRYREKVN